MKPWFEKEIAEADILKFPMPKAKVIRMPNVQEYPDFITGVSDLQAKQKDGTISQETYDKLYTDLIHRFMKKESFETPWYLREAEIGQPTPASISTYIGNINQLLKTNHAFQIEKNMPSGPKLLPTPRQQIKSLNDVIRGKIDGQDQSIAVRRLFKSPEIKGKKGWNIGYVSEGLFGMGLFLALLKDPNTLNGTDISQGVLKFLKTNGGTINKVNPKTKDKISLRVKLPRNNWIGLITPETHQDGEIQAHNNSIASYVNNSKDFKDIDNAFRHNEKIDSVEVIADGVSQQKATTVDVYIKYAGGNTVKFERSIKSGKVVQFGQGSTGGALDNLDVSREERWDYQEEFWQRFGIDLSNVEETFLGDPSLQNAFDHTYAEAAQVINAGLVGNKEEKRMLKLLFKGAQETASAKIVHIYSTGYKVMDFKKLDKFVKSANLKAEFKTQVRGGKIAKVPSVVITDQEGTEFMSMVLKVEGKKSSNQINMGPLLKKVTTVE